MNTPNSKPHFHQCGRVHGGWLEGYGCEYLFKHTYTKELSLVSQHMCPACGRGPWYYELSIEELESAKAEKDIL